MADPKALADALDTPERMGLDLIHLAGGLAAGGTAKLAGLERMQAIGAFLRSLKDRGEVAKISGSGYAIDSENRVMVDEDDAGKRVYVQEVG